MAVEQWVNLTKDSKFVADEIPNDKRLGELHYELTFAKAILSEYKIKVEPVGDQAAYEQAEMNRNVRFTLQHIRVNNNSGKKKLKVDDSIILPAAGGNEFKVKAKLKKTVVEAEKILTVRRKLFYQVMQMTGLTAGATGGMEQAFWNPGKKYYIKMKREGGVPSIAMIHNLDSNTEHNNFINAARAAFSLKSKGECSYAIVFVNYIASPGEFVQRANIPVDLGSKLFNKGSGTEVTVPVDHFLWHDIDPADDLAKKWLKGGTVAFQEAGSTTWRNIPLNPDDFSVDTSSPAYTYGGHKKIKIRLETSVGQYWFSRKKGTLRVNLRLGAPRGWTNGFAYNNLPLIAIAKKVVWKDQPGNTLAYTLVHEVGHKVGMVPDGQHLKPKAPSTLYGETATNQKGHQGPHCSLGAVYSGVYWSGAPACVMFGANGAYAGTVLNHAPDTFCGECAQALRKMDLHVASLAQAAFLQQL
jgi:type VI secretion system secreted protein VgrG